MCYISDLLFIVLLLFPGPRDHHQSFPAEEPSHRVTHAVLHDPVRHEATDGSGVHGDCTSPGREGPPCC